jgi:hypothetical protein
MSALLLEVVVHGGAVDADGLGDLGGRPSKPERGNGRRQGLDYCRRSLLASRSRPLLSAGATTYPEREQNWYPISKLGWFTGHIREGITVTRRQLELLQPARSQPYLLDDATVARIIGVHHDQAGDLDLFQNQADRWKASPDLTEAQRAGIAAYEALIAQLRQVNSEVLAVAAELASGTIETVLAKSDLELGIEALMRGLRP